MTIVDGTRVFPWSLIFNVGANPPFRKNMSSVFPSFRDILLAASTSKAVIAGIGIFDLKLSSVDYALNDQRLNINIRHRTNPLITHWNVMSTFDTISSRFNQRN